MHPSYIEASHMGMCRTGLDTLFGMPRGSSIYGWGDALGYVPT